MSAVIETAIMPTVIPYYREKNNLPSNVLNLIYKKLCAEQLDRLLFHNRSVSEEEFVKFADEEALTSIFLDQSNGRYAGIAWLARIEQCDAFTKGQAGFAFFKDYWRPELTERFGKICLSQWFNVAKIDIVYGLTPVPNRTARRFCKRMHFQYVARVPDFLSFYGRSVDCDVGILRKAEFNEWVKDDEGLRAL